MAEFVSGDTASELVVTCKDDDEVAIDLTGCTVKLRWQEATGAVADRTMTIVSAAQGKVSYKFLADDLYAGSMSFEVKVTDSEGFILRNPSLITEMVREAL